MSNDQARGQRAVFLAVLALSALTMIALVSLYPVRTLIATGMLLVAFGIAAHLARWIETDAGGELEGEPHP